MCEIYVSWEHRNVTVIIVPILDGSIISFLKVISRFRVRGCIFFVSLFI